MGAARRVFARGGGAAAHLRPRARDRAELALAQWPQARIAVQQFAPSLQDQSMSSHITPTLRCAPRRSAALRMAGTRSRVSPRPRTCVCAGPVGLGLERGAQAVGRGPWARTPRLNVRPGRAPPADACTRAARTSKPSGPAQSARRSWGPCDGLDQCPVGVSRAGRSGLPIRPSLVDALRAAEARPSIDPRLARATGSDLGPHKLGRIDAC